MGHLHLCSKALEISVVDIGSFINGNACILARGGI